MKICGYEAYLLWYLKHMRRETKWLEMIARWSKSGVERQLGGAQSGNLAFKVNPGLAGYRRSWSGKVWIGNGSGFGRFERCLNESGSLLKKGVERVRSRFGDFSGGHLDYNE